jgi:hypothetical protein
MPQTTKALASLVLAFLVTIAVIAVVITQSEDSVLLRKDADTEVPWGATTTDYETPESFQEVMVEDTEVKTTEKAMLEKTLKNICKLRAFAELAYDKANEMKLTRSSADAGLISFVLAFAKEAVSENDKKEDAKDKAVRAKELQQKQMKKEAHALPDEYYLLRNLPFPANYGKAQKVVKESTPKPYTFNVIVDYAKAVASATWADTRGFNMYLMHHLTSGVTGGKDLTMLTHGRYTLKYKQPDVMTYNWAELGFTEEPFYLRKLGVSPIDWATKVEEIEKASKSADVLAATAWLHSGAKKTYTSFMGKEVAKAMAIKNANFEKKYKAALDAIKVWYRDRGDMKKLLKGHEDGKEGPAGMGKVLRPLVTEGVKAASFAKQNPVPSIQTMKQAAATAATEFVKKISNEGVQPVAKEIKKIEVKAEKKKGAKVGPSPPTAAPTMTPTAPFVAKITTAYTNCAIAYHEKIQYLDRQHVVAYPKDDVLTGFVFTGSGCHNNKMRYKQWSTTTPTPDKKGVEKQTACSAFVNMPDEYLDRQHLDCGSNGAITFFQAGTFGCSGNDKRYKYTCNEFKHNGGITTKYTTCAEARGQVLAYLDRQAPSCPTGTALSSFHLTGNGCSGKNMRYQYNCLALTPKKPTSAPTGTPTPPPTKGQNYVLACGFDMKSSGAAGVVKTSVPPSYNVVVNGKHAYGMTGGGLNQKINKFNKMSAIEQMRPDGKSFTCDTAYGGGHLDCYGIYCMKSGQTKNAGLQCITKSVRVNREAKAGTAKLPAGYTMTGGGLVNHHKTWDINTQFEQSRPEGNNGWLSDMGFGWGDFTSYVTGCKDLKCVTVRQASEYAAPAEAKCPDGYAVTGCGMQHNKLATKMDSAALFNYMIPQNNPQWGSTTRSGGGGFGTCKCQMGGTDPKTKSAYYDEIPYSLACYARCCKLTDAAKDK